MIKEEAIEILSDMRAEYNIFSDDEEEATWYHALSWAIQALNEQQRTGRWIKTGQSFVFPEKFRNYSCSECGYDIDKTEFNYCPNCGAKMQEVEE